MTIESSHGSLVVTIPAGEVLPEQSTYDGDEIRPIIKFDLAEWCKYYDQKSLPQSLDILDVGYWNKDGTYEPPAYDWRKEVKEMRGGK